MADLGIVVSIDSRQYQADLRKFTQETQAASKSLSDSIGKVALSNKDLVKSSDSLAVLGKRYRELNKEIENLSPNTAEFIQKSAELRLVGQRIEGIEKSIKGVNTQLEKPTSGFFDGIKQGIGTFSAFAIGGAIIEGIKALVSYTIELGKESVELASKVRGVNSALGFAAGSAEGGAAAYSRFKDTANELGISIEKNQVAYKNFIVSATQSGQSLNAAEKEFKQVAIAMTAMGLSAEDSNGVLLALGQIASKGTVSAEELRGQIGERLPGAFAIAARSIGVTESKLNDMLQKGEVVSKDFLPKFTNELEKTFGATAQQNVNSYAATVNKFDNQILELKTSFGQALIPMLSQFYSQLTKIGEAFGVFSQKSTISSNEVSNGLILQKEKLQDLVFAITNVNKGEDVRKELISQLNAEYPAFLKGLNAETASNEELFQRLDKVNDAYDKKIRLQVAQESLMSIEKELKALETQRFDLLKAEADLLRRSASTKKETGFVSAAQLQNQNTLQKNANDFTKQATEFTKDQITQKKLELSYQEELVKEYLKGSQGLNEILGISEKSTQATVEGIKNVKKATKELAESGSLGDFENQLKKINETFQNKKLSSSQVADLLGKKEDIEAQIKRLKELYGIVKKETDPATGSLVSLKKQLAEIQTQINESPNDLNLLTALQVQAVVTTASIKDVENQIAKAKRMAETGGALPSISGISNLPSQGQIAPAENILIAPQVDTSQLDKLIGKLNEVDASLLGTQRKVEEAFKQFKESQITALGDAVFNLGTAFGNVAAGSQTAGEAFSQFAKDTLTAVLVSAPRLLGLDLLKTALTAPPPLDLGMMLTGVALLGISGLAGGLISQIGQQPQSIASQAATGTGLTGAATTQATAQGLGAANNAPQTITNVTVVLETNGIIREIQKQEYINGELKGL